MGLFRWFRGNCFKIKSSNPEQNTVVPPQETSTNQEHRNVPRTGGISRGSGIAGASRGSDIAGTSRGSNFAGTSGGYGIAGTSNIAGTPRGPSGNQLSFSYSYLSDATNNFSSESLIGECDSGNVFRGRFPETNQFVAVKQLNHRGAQFMDMELHMHSRFRHLNIINLIGYCVEGNHSIVVYEYMPLRSLQHCLHHLGHGGKPLDWNARMEIAFGVAKALVFLHDQRIIFRNLKSSNVLLDEEFHPKLCDFGMAKLGPEPADDRLHVSTMTLGNPGYWAPEYMLGTITMKTDVYSFGILLLEIVTGQEASQGPDRLVDLARSSKSDGNIVVIADSNLKGQFPVSKFEEAASWALACTQTDPDLRPAMQKVMPVMHCLKIRKYDPNPNEQGQGMPPAGC